MDAGKIPAQCIIDLITNGLSASEEILRLLRKKNFRCCFQNGEVPYLVQSQMSLVPFTVIRDIRPYVLRAT